MRGSQKQMVANHKLVGVIGKALILLYYFEAFTTLKAFMFAFQKHFYLAFHENTKK